MAWTWHGIMGDMDDMRGMDGIGSHVYPVDGRLLACFAWGPRNLAYLYGVFAPYIFHRLFAVTTAELI